MLYLYAGLGGGGNVIFVCGRGGNVIFACGLGGVVMLYFVCGPWWGW